MNEILPAEQAQQVADRDLLVHTAMFVVDTFALDHADDLLRRVTGASRSRLLVEAAVGALLGGGMITVVPESERPEWMPVSLPEHLQPDVAAAVEELRRYNRGLPS